MSTFPAFTVGRVDDRWTRSVTEMSTDELPAGPAGEVLIAIPDPTTEANLYEFKIPVLGSLIGSMSFSSKEIGLTDFPPQDRPPVLIPFFAFRIMVGAGVAILLVALAGAWLR